MMRTAPALKLLALFLFASAGSAFAQTRPSDAPPKLERIEEGADAPVTIVPKRDQPKVRIEETRKDGMVKEVEVTTGNSTYTMKGKHPASVTEMGPGVGSTLRPPQWQVLEFDLSKKKQSQRDEEAAAAAAAAPPAAVPPPPSVK